ncbi:hypothetical protein D1872_249550 [compost metagenome]
MELLPHPGQTPVVPDISQADDAFWGKSGDFRLHDIHSFGIEVEPIGRSMLTVVQARGGMENAIPKRQPSRFAGRQAIDPLERLGERLRRLVARVQRDGRYIGRGVPQEVHRPFHPQPLQARVHILPGKLAELPVKMIGRGMDLLRYLAEIQRFIQRTHDSEDGFLHSSVPVDLRIGSHNTSHDNPKGRV